MNHAMMTAPASVRNARNAPAAIAQIVERAVAHHMNRAASIVQTATIASDKIPARIVHASKTASMPVPARRGAARPWAKRAAGFRKKRVRIQKGLPDWIDLLTPHWRLWSYPIPRVVTEGLLDDKPLSVDFERTELILAKPRKETGVPA